jgi:hypothetical protein
MSSAFEIPFLTANFFSAPNMWSGGILSPGRRQCKPKIQAFGKALPNHTTLTAASRASDSWAHIRGELFLTLSPSDYQTLIYSNQFVESICQRWGEPVCQKLGNQLCAGQRRSPRTSDGAQRCGRRIPPGATMFFGGLIDLATDPHETDICTCMAAEIRQELNVDLACAD